MFDSYVFLAPLLLLPVIALLGFIGCGSFDAADTPATVVIKVAPETIDLGPGQTQQFQAFADGNLTTSVDWSPNAPSGLYKAADPRLAGVTTDTVTATSKSGTTTSAPASVGKATVNLKSATVTVSPPLVSLRAGEQQQFTATVQGSSNQNVTWTGAPNGLYTAPNPYVTGAPPVTITATSNADPTAKGTATVNLIGTQAKFVTTDTTTKGSWKGIYGSKGWALAASPANLINLPTYVANLKPPATNPFDFQTPTTDPRGLDRPPAFTDKFAQVWFDPTTLQVEISFTDANPHRVAVYFVDWETTTRAQKIEILDNSGGPTNALDTRNLTAFNGGQYLVWDLSGKIILRVTKTGTDNAVLSGILFD
jgi:hypothetical protein